MTTLDKNAKRGFFSIYKPGQGKWVRWGTVAAAVIIIAFGGTWVYDRFAAQDDRIKITATIVWVLATALLAFWIVNKPSLAEFFIMTESEMRKVTWPSRREVINSTKIVILLTVILGLLLFMVDVGFVKLFEWMGVA